MQILPSNLRALEKNNPPLARWLSTPFNMGEDYAFEPTKEAVQTVRVRRFNGDREVKTYLASRYTPLKEAERFAEHQYTSGELVLFGFGLGFHVDALFRRLAPGQMLRIVEGNAELIRLALATFDYGEVLASPDVVLVCTQDSDELHAIWEAAAERNAACLVHRPSVSCLSDDLASFRLLLTEHVFPGNNEERQSLARQNHFANLSIPANRISALYNTHPGETAFIVSSGPSLETFGPHLNRLTPHGFVISAGSALRYLTKINVSPDYFVLMDAIPSVRRQLEGCENMQIPMLFSNFSCAEAVAGYLGPKYVYYCEPLGGAAADDVLAVGGSVATVAVAVALRMGVRRIVFIGQDLCFAGNRHHADGASIWKLPQLRFMENHSRVKNVRGEFVSTQPNLLNYRRWLEQKIAATPEVDFYNLVDEGLVIAGAQTVSLPQLVQLLLQIV